MHLCVYIGWLSGVSEGRNNATFYRDPLLWALGVWVLRAGRLRSFFHWCVGVLELENRL